MKIAVFHELPMGGARRVANDFGLELQKKHIVDEYVVDSKKSDEEKKYYRKVYFYQFAPKKWEGKNWKIRFYKDTVELYYLYRLHRKIAGDIDKRRYDIVVVHPSKFTQSPFVLSLLKTKNVYYAEEAYRIMYEPYFKLNFFSKFPKNVYEYVSRYIKKQIDRKNVKKASSIFVSSENTRSNILKYYSRKSTLCYPGIDVGFFKPKKCEKDIDVLFVGSQADNTDGYYDLRKGLDILDKNVNLVTVGDGTNWIDDFELRDIYRRSRVVFCGAQNEPFGLVPLEAIACGCRVVAVSQGGYKETAIVGATHFVERDPKDIAKTLKNALNRKKISRYARKNLLKKWGIKKRTKELAAALEKVNNP